MSKKIPSSGVSIGNVTGGIQGSIIAGRDVKNATISLGGRPTSADQEPTADQLNELLAEIQQELAKVLADKKALQQISPATPFTAQGAEQSVKNAVELVSAKPDAGGAESAQKSLHEATSLLDGILGGAKKIAEKAGEVSDAVVPLVEKLAPLVEKVGVAALWVTKLWLQH